MSEEPKHKVLLLFLRATETVGTKKGRLFYRLTQDEWDAAERGKPPVLDWAKDNRLCCYGEKSIKWLTPGSVCRVEAKDAEASSIYGTTAVHVGVWPDDALRLEWAANDKAWKTKWERDSLQKKYAKDDFFKEALEPLRVLYGKTIGSARRAALLASVIQEITNGI